MNEEQHDAFEKKILEMNLADEQTLSKEEEEAAWKEILFETEKKERKTIPFVKLAVACSVILLGVAALFYFKKQNLIYQTGAHEKLEVTLKDGSKVNLNNESKLTIGGDFGDGLRQVNLQGEAFFEVKKNPKQAFIISLEDHTVTVLGTSFNLEHVNQLTKVAVESGVVKLSTENESIELVRHEVGWIDEEGKLTKLDWDQNTLSWHSKDISFKEKPMKEVVELLTELSSKSVKVSDSIAECRLTLRVKYEKIEEVFDIISETLGISWKEESKRILFYGDGC
ncbi:MAG: FecR domain-containing protein [Cyclobacteriaceae bacterium]